VNFKTTGFLAAAALAAALSTDAGPETALGQFEGHADVGSPRLAGSAAYNAVSQEYTLTAAGANMWAARDEFHFAWKKMTGDFILQARVELLGKGVDPHRKLGWIVRSTLDDDSPYADAAIHGDGLTSLQVRKTKGAATEQVTSAITGADVVQLERKGSTYTMSVARFGEPFTVSTVSDLALGDEVYAGLFLCSHNPDVVEKAVFRDVRIIRPAKDGFVPYRDYIGSHLEILDVASGHRQVVHSAADPFEAPNWTRDGRALIYNTSGRVEGRGASSASTWPRGSPRSSTPPSRTATTTTTSCPSTGPCSPSATRARATTSRRSTPSPWRAGRRSASRPWGRRTSTDGRRTGSSSSTPGGRDNEFDIYRIPSDGSGPEVNLTKSKGLDDGPEYSPDGRYVYFNSLRSGTMQIWRMDADGSHPQQVTRRRVQQLVPAPLADGQWIAFLSFPKDVPPADHPYYKRVYLRLMPTGSGFPRVIAYIYGGQGTVNVPSWSPDGRMLAFVSNSDLK
jgi:hypothetical protein